MTERKLPPIRGLVLGKQIELEARPPAQDVLNQPLTLDRPPPYLPPEDDRWPGLRALLDRLGWTTGGTRQREIERIHVVTARTLAAVAPPVANQLRASGWLRRHGLGGRSGIPEVTHPYALLESFQTLFRMPRELPKEQRFLELVLALTLRQFSQAISGQTGGRFAFDLEAMEYMLQGTKLEHAIKRTTSHDERLDLVQRLYDTYTNGKNYYMFSLIARERSANQGKLFLLYCHAVQTLARIHWDGSMIDTPLTNRLPSRREALFLFKRDRGLLARCADDETYMTQVKSLVAAFPP